MFLFIYSLQITPDTKLKKFFLFETPTLCKTPLHHQQRTLPPDLSKMDVETSDPTQLTHCNMSDDFHPSRHRVV
ncbi:hypothetical protein CEXT_582981 [Caerostris extrusa]|uniref:Uncharacterized protein n=1 Tax=Caerostris extrusa TaxID=172846 RepID=A0AAV4TGU1_CAEEX|nr:hypothetical protein CEXT_582981 [Caerostris extrusa]